MKIRSQYITFCFRVREKLGCKGNFPEVFDKVNRRARTGRQRFM